MTIFNKANQPIGFFDSGVGGLSVLKQAIKLLPKEDFIYFGDSKNAPYGIKTVKEVRELSFNAANFLISKGVKAMVVACNTATSAAIQELRNEYNQVPIIGIEPALKPAIQLNRAGKILIMATPVTLAEKKFNDLMKSFEAQTDIVPLPCPGLAELIESGKVNDTVVRNFLQNKLEPYMKQPIGSIVLGCTHYPFIKDALSSIIGSDVPIIDGSVGTAKQLKRKLITYNILNTEERNGTVEIFNSLNEKSIIDLSYKLLNE